MVHPDMRFIRSVAIMVGSIVGVGLFGLPYVMAKSGFLLGLLLLLMVGWLMTGLQLMYAEVAIQTKGHHRLAGYVETYIGTKSAHVAFWISSLQLLGALIAFTIVASQFLHTLFSPLFGGSQLIYACLFTLAVFAFTKRGMVFISKLEAVFLTLFGCFFLVVISATIPFIRLENLSTVHWQNILVPYGPLLFALSGLSVVPELKDLLGKTAKHRMGYVILIAMTIILCLYSLISLVGVGAMGAGATPFALTGLAQLFGSGFMWLTALLGFMTVFSIAVLVNIQWQNALRFDKNIKATHAYLLVGIAPLICYLIGARNFISVIGFAGAVLSGMVALFIVTTYERMRRSPVCTQHHCLNIPPVISFFVALVFALGIITHFFLS